MWLKLMPFGTGYFSKPRSLTGAMLQVPNDAGVLAVMALKPGLGLDYFENYQSWPPGRLPRLPAEIHLVLDGAG